MRIRTVCRWKRWPGIQKWMFYTPDVTSRATAFFTSTLCAVRYVISEIKTERSDMMFLFSLFD